MIGVAMYKDMQSADDIVKRYAPLVHRIAYHLKSRLPDSVLIDDLLQSGMMGLLEASGKFNDSKGASFETYAGIRIRGAMIDDIRKGDWVPRSVHKNARSIAAAITKIEQTTGETATDHEIAEMLDISLDKYHSIVKDAANGHIFAFDELGVTEDYLTDSNNGANEPYNGLRDEKFKDSLKDAIDTLPEREKLILALYYDEELNLKEIGEVINVSESRVSQIHSQAMVRLKSRMNDW
ncbi:MAG: RNA polymerase sigma factor for flagellar operon FliA [Enterobacterales bacterium]|jgi:RNA polymerase sigma factor for flagellar operon FliA